MPGATGFDLAPLRGEFFANSGHRQNDRLIVPEAADAIADRGIQVILMTISFSASAPTSMTSPSVDRS